MSGVGHTGYQFLGGVVSLLNGLPSVRLLGVVNLFALVP